MDELTAQLAGSFNVTQEPNSTAAQHPRFAQYKSKTTVDQETRRKRILEEQKKQRFDFLNHVRNLSEDVWDNTDAESVCSVDSMDVQVPDDSVKVRKPGKYYRNQLMFSEWLVEKPADFEEEWITVVCPWGKRNLIVASRGRTHAYAKSGSRINSFSSHLPGGSFAQPGRKQDNVILDCLFNENEGVYYILDIMCWKNHPVYDSETEFRFYWLTSKIQECPEVMEKSPDNPYKFIPLPNFPCSNESISAAVNTATFDIDGVLFYHKRAHYTFGSTPLVVWLKPYMIPEMLGIEVSDKLHATRPDNYTTYAAHMEKVETERKQRQAERQKNKGKSPKGDGGKGKGNKKKKDGGGGGGDKNKQFQHMEYCEEDRNLYPKRAYGQDFRMDLMFSEWLIDIPEDFETEWFHIVCPTGKRHLVLTGEGETISQTKNGMLMNSFRSFLPGGHPYSSSPNEMVLLDTIYNKQSDTYFIMDCMAWNTQYLHQCEAEFRMYWLQEQISQIQGLNQTSKYNWHPFVLLESFPATKEGLEKSLINVEYEVDGILFFKKSAPYVAGNTENVLWIKPYMIPDVLPDVIVPNYLRKRKPAEFDYEKHKEKVVKEKQERKERGQTARRRPIPQRSINIDKLVDDIGRIYISKQQEAGVEMSKQEQEIMAKFKQPQGKKGKKSKGQGRGQGVLGDYAYNSSYYGDRYGYDCYGDNYYGNYDDSYYGTYDDFSGYYGDGSSYYGADNYGQYGYGMAGVRDTWGYDDHSRQNKSPQKGRGRGLLDTKPMTAYALTHNIFKK